MGTDPVVVVLNDFCYVQGGASKVAIDEAIGLARAGIEVVFIGAVGPPCPALSEAPLTLVCLDQHELLDAARHPTALLQGLWNVTAGRRLGDVLARLPREQTVVHLHGYTKALTASPVRTASRAGFPIVCTLHDFFAACPNGAFFDYSTMTPCGRRALSGACIAAACDKRHHAHKLYRVARAAIQRGAGGLPGRIGDYIVLSERSLQLMAPYLPCDARFHRLANSVDIPAGPPAPVAGNRSILYVGRLDLEKGVRLLAETTGRLGLDCVMVGDGPLRAELAALPWVTVTGWVAPETVRDHLLRARCIVFPSLWYETFGLVTAEAAASGVPAIVSDTCAAAERIDDGVTGWRFRSGDPADLARCLMLVGDDDRVAAAGAAAYRAHWAAQATPQQHVRRLVELYRQILRDRAAGASQCASSADSAAANRGSVAS